MSDENKKAKTHDDYITFTPESIKFITLEEMYIARDYFYILRFLTDTPKTVKEIYEDAKDKGLRIHVKAIYRHLEKLDEAGLVIVAGHRSRKGRGSPEKLYQRTARLFYLGPKEALIGTVLEERGREHSNHLAIILKGLLQTEKQETPALNETIWRLLQIHHQMGLKLVERAKTDKDLARILNELDIAALSYLLDLATTMAALLQHPELAEELQNMLDLNPLGNQT